jgi:phosphoribosylglycinamide formyltransferase-1
MIHLVTKELDKGPPITFCTFPLRGPSIDPLWERHEEALGQKGLNRIIREEGERNPLFQEIRERGVMRELPLIVHTLKTFSEGKIRIDNHQFLVDNHVQHQPYCLTEQIEASITNEQRNA